MCSAVGFFLLLFILLTRIFNLNRQQAEVTERLAGGEAGSANGWDAEGPVKIATAATRKFPRRYLKRC